MTVNRDVKDVQMSSKSTLKSLTDARNVDR